MTVAVPPASVAVVVELSPKSTVTVPDGVPAPGATGATVTLNVTCSPATDGSGDDVTDVVVAADSTVCVSEPLEPVKSALPPYVAVTAYGLPAVP
ncbi:hypothetical protein, partial [Streptomyces sp. NPDC004065]|uniref:hypothetical protein n=1 Tax=Streptomyces sp. NPDC004065 TaxID=3364689 RepID=UPI00384FF70A